MGNKVYSYWERTVLFENIDIAIVGSGIVGLSTAINLKKKYPKKKIAVIEKHNFPYGASTKNAGFACFGSVGELLDDLDHMDEQMVIDTLKLRYEGLLELQSLIAPSKMEFVLDGGYEVYHKGNEIEFEKSAEQISSLNQLIKEHVGIKETFSIVTNNTGMNLAAKMIKNQHEGRLNPMMMIKEFIRIAVSLDVQFVWNFELEEIDEGPNCCQMRSKDAQQLQAQQIVICTNAFTNAIIDEDDIVPARNQVMVTTEIDELDISGCYHLNKGYTYFRNIGNRILLGGARDLDIDIETTSTLGGNPKILNHLEKLLRKIILDNKEFNIEYQWSGIIATGKVKKPVVKQKSDRIYLGVRLGGMGVAIGSMVGKKVSELVN